MEIKSNPKKTNLLTAMWNGIKKPLICAAIMLVAAIALIALQDRKTNYDKNQNVTYQLVGDAGLKHSDVRSMTVVDFAAAVAARVSPNGGHLPHGIDALRVMKKSSEDASNQSFKTPLELSSKLAESITRQKNEKLKSAHEELNKAIEAEVANTTLANKALGRLEKEANDEKLEVAALMKDADVAAALREKKEITSARQVPLGDVKEKVREFYASKGSSLTTT